MSSISGFLSNPLFTKYSDHCTNVENDRFSSGGSRPLGLDALLLMKVPNLFIVLKLYRNLRFLRNFVPIVLGRAGNIGDYFPSEAREIIGDVPCPT